MRSLSTVFRPSRLPVSVSCCLTQPLGTFAARIPCRSGDAQAVPAASNLLRNRQDCCRSARIFCLVIQNQPHRSGAQFFWITCSVLRLSHNPVPLLLGLRQTRGGSDKPDEPDPLLAQAAICPKIPDNGQPVEFQHAGVLAEEAAQPNPRLMQQSHTRHIRCVGKKRLLRRCFVL